jgi:hypothetical protein
LRIYDVGGRLLRTLVEGRLEAGAHEVAWDRRMSDGAVTPAGMYFLDLRIGANRVTWRRTPLFHRQ